MVLAEPNSVRRWERSHTVRPRDVAGEPAAEQHERELDLLAQQLEHLARALLAARGEAPERRAAGEHGARAERERLDDVGAAADAAVDQHLDRGPSTASTTSGSASIVAGDAVELAAAVVRDDHARGAVLARRGARPRR